MNLGRRTLLLGASTGLGGCGFHPLYGPLANGKSLRPELASIFVDPIAERPGQLLRQALQARLEGSGGTATKRFELVASFNIAAEAIGIQPDTSSSRIRINAKSDWTLFRLEPTKSGATAGVARATDGIDVNNQQYFALDLEQSAAAERLAREVANEIVLDLAVYFRDHPTTA